MIRFLINTFCAKEINSPVTIRVIGYPQYNEMIVEIVDFDKDNPIFKHHLSIMERFVIKTSTRSANVGDVFPVKYSQLRSIG